MPFVIRRNLAAAEQYNMTKFMGDCGHKFGRVFELRNIDGYFFRSSWDVFVKYKPAAPE